MFLSKEDLVLSREALLLHSFRKSKASKNCSEEFKEIFEGKARRCIEIKDRVQELIDKPYNDKAYLVSVENGREIRTPLLPSEDGLSTDDYRQAIEIQGASNLSGIVNSFANMMVKVRNESRKKPETNNNEWMHSHPIVIVYTYKICELSGLYPDHAPFDRAYNFCKDKVRCG